jgi:hypothetical protein
LAVEYYNKGQAFMQAIREATKESDLSCKNTLLSQIKNGVNLAYDVKKNMILKLIDDFDKKYLRLQIV